MNNTYTQNECWENVSDDESDEAEEETTETQITGARCSVGNRDVDSYPGSVENRGASTFDSAKEVTLKETKTSSGSVGGREGKGAAGDGADGNRSVVKTSDGFLPGRVTVTDGGGAGTRPIGLLEVSPSTGDDVGSDRGARRMVTNEESNGCGRYAGAAGSGAVGLGGAGGTGMNTRGIFESSSSSSGSASVEETVEVATAGAGSNAGGDGESALEMPGVSSTGKTAIADKIPTPAPAPPKLSINTPVDATGMTMGESPASVSSGCGKLSVGGIGTAGGETGGQPTTSGAVSPLSAGNTPTSTSRPRKRNKTKRLQEYMGVDVDFNGVSPREKENDARRGEGNRTPDGDSSSSSPLAAAVVTTAPGTLPSPSCAAATPTTAVTSSKPTHIVRAVRSTSVSPGATAPGSGVASSSGRVVPWRGKDWGGKASSDAAVRRIKRREADWEKTADGTLVGKDKNHFFCRCGIWERRKKEREGVPRQFLRSGTPLQPSFAPLSNSSRGSEQGPTPEIGASRP